MARVPARYLKMFAGLAGLFTATVTLAPTAAEAQPTLVIVVRHGEKQPTPANDPSLSEAGVARAHALDSALAHLSPSTIVVSATKRTPETAAVVAKRVGVSPTVVPLQGPHVQSVADAVMKANGVVLVVGHSNTVPAIVHALGGPKLPDLCDASYATLFAVVPARDGKPAQVLRSSYGKADAVGADQCPGMTAR